jgi:hypothetical protein
MLPFHLHNLLPAKESVSAIVKSEQKSPIGPSPSSDPREYLVHNFVRRKFVLDGENDITERPDSGPGSARQFHVRSSPQFDGHLTKLARM